MAVDAPVAQEIADGDVIGTVQLARLQCLAPSSVFRWIAKGLPAASGGRVRREAVRRGRRWLTSRAALRRFYAALPTITAIDAQAPSPSRTRSRSSREAEIAAAGKKLKESYGM
jgi:hypothetical protein